MSRPTRFLIYALVLVAGLAYVILPYRVGLIIGESMAPTFRSGAPYLMRRMTSTDEIGRGDVVVFRRNGRNYVKRVLGLPGDRFYILPRTSSGVADLLIRGDLLKNYLDLARKFPQVRVTLRTVPSNSLYVVGDNLEASEDSRGFGFIGFDSIEGLVEEAPAPSRPEFSALARAEQGA